MFYNFIEYFTELHTRHGNNYGYISYKAFIGRGPGIYFFEFIISTKPEVSQKSLILITYHSRNTLGLSDTIKLMHNM